MLSQHAPIGIFDSGLGGLSVLKEVVRILPGEDVLFIGDTARQPYGPRSSEEVSQYSVEIARFLARKNAKIIIIACNTASIAGLEAAQQAVKPVPVVGMIDAGVRGALAATTNGKVGVWGTEMTIASKAHIEQLKRANNTIQALGVAPSELLRLAEKGKIDDIAYINKLVAEAYAPLEEMAPDTLVLGCTDFPCVRPMIERTIPPQVRIIDPAEEVVQGVKDYLSRADLLSPARRGKYKFHVTGEDIKNFERFTKIFMQMDPVDVEPLDLSEFTKTEWR